MGAMEPIWQRISASLGRGPSTGRSRGGEATPSSEPSDFFTFFDKLSYNHRKYFILGYLVLFISVIPVADAWAGICFLSSLVSLFFFAKGFTLRNVLLLHRRDLIAARDSDPAAFSSSVSPPPSYRPSPLKEIPGARPPRKAIVFVGSREGLQNPDDMNTRESSSGASRTHYDPEWDQEEGQGDRGEDLGEWRDDQGESQKDSQRRGQGDPQGDEDDTVWEVEDSDFISSMVSDDGITIRGVGDPLTGPEGRHYTLGELQLERYMILFVTANVLFFGGYFGLRLSAAWMGIFILFSFFILIAAVVDKMRTGVKLYPIYRDMIDKGLIFHPDDYKMGKAYSWYEKNLMKEDEHVLHSDTISLNNWNPNSYTLTNRGIYLEERNGLYAGRSIFLQRLFPTRFLYIPLLSLKGMKPVKERINRSAKTSMMFTAFWMLLIGPDDPFFYFFLFILGIEATFGMLKAGIQIQGRALNLTFILSRDGQQELMYQRMHEIDQAHKRRMQDPDADSELVSYAWMEKFAPCPNLKDVKKGVRSASTGIILPTFFLSMKKLIEILDEDTSGFDVIVFVVSVFALYRIVVAITNAWRYQKYLVRPKGSSLDLWFMKLSGPEALIILGYTILGVGIAHAINQDYLPLAYTPGIIGGLLVLLGRYTFNSTFRGIDYQEKSHFKKPELENSYDRFMRQNKRMIPPVAAFIILLLLMGISQPYFGESRAELPGRFYGPGAGNNWRHLDNESEDLVGLMGMFSLSIRVYEDDAEDGNGYPAIFSVLTMKFPVTPDEEDMLDEMKKFLREMSDEQNINLDEPPTEGVNVTVQGYSYIYFIYNGTAANGTSRFTVGEEMRTIVTAFKVDREKSFVITVGMAKVSNGRLVDVQNPFPGPDPPNPTDTRDFENWNELTDQLIPNVRV